MENGSLMKVKSIAECSRSILQYFWPALSDNSLVLETNFWCVFLSGGLRQILL